MALDTVAKIVAAARTLLLDEVDSPYRYSDNQLILNLNIALAEGRKVRPDIYVGVTVPEYVALTDTTPFPIDAMYRLPYLFFMIGLAQMRDDEETQDQRAAAFLGLFTQKLLTVS